MKRLSCIISLLFTAFAAFAQGGGIPLMDKAQGKRVSFHYTYSLSQNGSDFSPITDGEVLVEGNAYILKGLGLEVRSDGCTRWTLDSDAKELLIETVSDDDLFTNPALFLSSYRNYMDSIVVNASAKDSLDVTLVLDNDTRARFVLSGVKFMELQGKSGFPLDEKSLSSDFVITDLR